MSELLVELFSEEIPPNLQISARDQFKKLLNLELSSSNLPYKDFEIYSQNVRFNQENETATSANDSTFIAKKTKIESEGFNIIQDGNIIKFQGKTKLTLSK